MYYPGSPVLINSTNGEAVMQIKAKLNDLGYGQFDTTNPSFGTWTAVAVKKFQDAMQLHSDGIVGPLTWQRLFYTTTIAKPSSSRLGTRAIEVARTQLFVKELTGHNDGKEVETYLKAVGLYKGFPWCQAFVYWCYEQAAKSLVVPNPVTRTGGVMDHWNKTLGDKIAQADVHTGDIFIMDYGKGMGHTGLVTEVRIPHVHTIEGNTNVQGHRDGVGVFERVREIKSIIGFIRY